MNIQELRSTASRYSRGELVPALDWMELYDAIRSGRVTLKRREKQTAAPALAPQSEGSEFLQFLAKGAGNGQQGTQPEGSRAEGQEGGEGAEAQGT